MCVLYLNGIPILRRKFWDDLDPDRFNYFPAVDLLGSCIEVTHLPVFVPNQVPEVPLKIVRLRRIEERRKKRA